MFKVVLALALVATAYAACSSTNLADIAQAQLKCAQDMSANSTACTCLNTAYQGYKGLSGCSSAIQTAVDAAIKSLEDAAGLINCTLTASSAATTAVSMVAAAVAALFML